MMRIEEADSTLNRHFKNIESVVNRENSFGGDSEEGIDPEDEPLDEGGLLVFSGGHSERKRDNRDAFKAQIKKRVLLHQGLQTDTVPKN